MLDYKDDSNLVQEYKFKFEEKYLLMSIIFNTRINAIIQ